MNYKKIVMGMLVALQGFTLLQATVVSGCGIQGATSLRSHDNEERVSRYGVGPYIALSFALVFGPGCLYVAHKVTQEIGISELKGQADSPRVQALRRGRVAINALAGASFMLAGAAATAIMGNCE